MALRDGLGTILQPRWIFLSVGETIDKFINITIVGKTESKDCSQFSLTMSWSDIYKFIDENGVVCAFLRSDELRKEAGRWSMLKILTEAVKSSACSHPSRSTASASSGSSRS